MSSLRWGVNGDCGPRDGFTGRNHGDRYLGSPSFFENHVDVRWGLCEKEGSKKDLQKTVQMFSFWLGWSP